MTRTKEQKWMPAQQRQKQKEGSGQSNVETGAENEINHLFVYPSVFSRLCRPRRHFICRCSVIIGLGCSVFDEEAPVCLPDI